MRLKRGRPAADPGWRWGKASGAKLRAAREALDLTQTVLAKRSKVQRSSVSEYESGTRAPSRTALARLARVLKVDPDTLRGGKRC